MKIVISFDEIKYGKVDELASMLIGEVWGVIEKNSAKKEITYSSVNFTEAKIAMQKIEKFIIKELKS